MHSVRAVPPSPPSNEPRLSTAPSDDNVPAAGGWESQDIPTALASIPGYNPTRYCQGDLSTRPDLREQENFQKLRRHLMHNSSGAESDGAADCLAITQFVDCW